MRNAPAVQSLIALRVPSQSRCSRDETPPCVFFVGTTVPPANHDPAGSKTRVGGGRPASSTPTMLLNGAKASSGGTLWQAALLFLAVSSLKLDFGAGFSATPPPPGTRKMFKARYPLEGGPPQVKLHVAVIVEDTRRAGGGSERENEEPGRLVLFDFLPAEPTALPTTFRLLTGQDVPGNLRERELRFLPAGTVFVGQSDATLEEMRKYVASYPDRLSLISNNCVTFVDAFVARHRLRPGRLKS